MISKLWVTAVLFLQAGTAGAQNPVNVSGRVVNLLRTDGVRVVLARPMERSFETKVQPDGSFAFSNVPPGNYIARLSLSGVAAGRLLTVGDKDLTDVVITYPRRFIVAAHVLVEGEGPASAALPEITLEARDSREPAAAPVTSSSNNNGILLFNLKDGEYKVFLPKVPPGYELKSIMYGPIDVQKAPFKIDGPVTWELVVRLGRK